MKKPLAALLSSLFSGLLLSGCIAPHPGAIPKTAEDKPKVEESAETKVRAEASNNEGVPPIQFPDPGPFKLVEKDGVEYWQARGDVGQFGGTLRLGSFGMGPKTFNAWDASDVESHGIGMLQFDSLVDYDPWTGKATPKLAKSYEVSPDGRVITFVMRKGLKWSDGHPLTADDVVFTYGTIVKEGYGEASARDTIATPGDYPEVRKVGENSVSFTFKQPFTPFLANLNAVMVAPKHILEPVTKRPKAEFRTFWSVSSDISNMVGSGPMILERYVPAQRYEFKRNPYYSFIDKEGRQLPYLDKMVVGIVPDLKTVAIKFQGKELDFMDIRSITGANARQLKQREAMDDFTMYTLGPDDGTLFLMFNMCRRSDPKTHKPYVEPAKQDWFNNTKFRQAISYSVDRRRIINNVLKGIGYPLSHCETPAAIYDNKNLKPIEYDPEKSKKLLAEAGFVKKGDELFDSKGRRVEFDLMTNSGNDIRDGICITLKEELKKLGIKVNYQPIDFATLTNRVHTSLEWQAIVMGLSGSRFEPYGGANVWKADGRLHMFDTRLAEADDKVKVTDARPWETEIDKCLDTAAHSTDEKKRHEYYNRFQEIAYTEQPFIYIYTPMLLTACRNNIGNYKPTPYGLYYTPKGSLHNLYEIYIKGAKH